MSSIHVHRSRRHHRSHRCAWTTLIVPESPHVLGHELLRLPIQLADETQRSSADMGSDRVCSVRWHHLSFCSEWMATDLYTAEFPTTMDG